VLTHVARLDAGTARDAVRAALVQHREWAATPLAIVVDRVEARSTR
jgi:hypothetical protein